MTYPPSHKHVWHVGKASARRPAWPAARRHSGHGSRFPPRGARTDLSELDGLYFGGAWGRMARAACQPGTVGFGCFGAGQRIRNHSARRGFRAERWADDDDGPSGLWITGPFETAVGDQACGVGVGLPRQRDDDLGDPWFGSEISGLGRVP